MQKNSSNILRVLSFESLRNIVIWVVLFFLLFNGGLWAGVTPALIIAGMSVLVMGAIIFINVKLLIPYLLLYRRRRIIYLLCSVLLITFLTYACVEAELWVFQALKVPLKEDLRLIYPISKFFGLFIVTFTIGNIFFFSKKMEEDAGQQEKLQAEKKILELKMLKTQINSHFLFNALNNIYSMVYFKDPEMAVHVLKLSQMMRYIIEDCESDYTSIEKEVKYIDNYIEFQQLRFETGKDIMFTKKVSNYTLKIPPMILQPMVENCFKHCSLDLNENSYIHMCLEADEKHLRFLTENTHPIANSDEKEKSLRIGLMNVRRRMDIIYEDRYTLDIQNNAENFRVELQINF